MSIVTAIPREWKSKIKQETLLQDKLASFINDDTYIMINNRNKLAKLVTSKENLSKTHYGKDRTSNLNRKMG